MKTVVISPRFRQHIASDKLVVTCNSELNLSDLFCVVRFTKCYFFDRQSLPWFTTSSP